MSLINKTIEDFSVQGFQDNKFREFTKADTKGKWSVFFFYPADFSFVCPTELEDLADVYDNLKSMNVEVFSVSTDTQYVHKAWHDESKAISKIKYPMLADPAGVLAKQFEVYLEDEGLALRGTFLVNPEGKIKLYEVNDLAIGRNSEELLRKIEAAQFVDKYGDQVCPARWKPGKDTLKPGIDLVGKI